MAITLDGTNGINFSGVIVAPDGSASAPSITNDGDTNTGIYFPAADNIGFATNGVIRGRWTTDGLCFGTDTAAANALDDYEEGTFTITLITGTLTSATGYYRKIGSQVTVWGDLGGFSDRASSNAVEINNLPFTSASNQSNGAGGAVLARYIGTLTSLASYVGGSSTNLTFYNISSSNYTVLTHANLNNTNSALLFNATYRAA